MPAPLRKAMGANVTGGSAAAIGPAGSTAGRTEQKAETQLGGMAGEAGVCFCPGHPGHPPESELLEATAFCGICMGIGMATAATTCPRIPMPKARSRMRTRSRATVPWLMNPQ